MTRTGDAARPEASTDDSADTAMEWIRLHGRTLGIGAIVAAVVVAGTWLVRASNEKKELNASRALAEAQRSVASGNLPLASADLQKVIQRFGSTSSGTQARLLLAQVDFQQNKFDDGLKLLDDVGSAGPLEPAMYALRGAGLEELHKPAEAAAAYLKAADATRLPSERESYRSDAARAYIAAGKKDEALKIWQAIADDPTAALNAEAKLRVGELGAQVASP
jgi:predicted negative regulator of RcsB-dependent stress response